VKEVGRIVKITAREGEGGSLAAGLLSVAEGMTTVDGCSLYLINRSASDVDVVWVLERWDSQQHLDAALQHPTARERIPEILRFVKPGGFERIELEPVGGHATASAVS
jgi:quinol monooxygenase YgiN